MGISRALGKPGESSWFRAEIHSKEQGRLQCRESSGGRTGSGRLRLAPLRSRHIPNRLIRPRRPRARPPGISTSQGTASASPFSFHLKYPPHWKRIPNWRQNSWEAGAASTACLRPGPSPRAKILQDWDEQGGLDRPGEAFQECQGAGHGLLVIPSSPWAPWHHARAPRHVPPAPRARQDGFGADRQSSTPFSMEAGCGAHRGKYPTKK